MQLLSRDLGCLAGVVGVGGRGSGSDLAGQAVPAAHTVQADEGQGQQSRHDDEELEDLVVDRRGEPTHGDVGEDDDGRHDEPHPQGPSQQPVHDLAQQVQVDAGDEQLGQGEAERVDQVRGGAVALEHELGHRAHLGAVVEGHHDQTQEDHGRDRADPEVVEGRHAVLGAVGRHSHDLDGAEVRRDEGDTRHPGRQGAARGEDAIGCGRLGAGDEPDADDEGEVDRDGDVVVPACGDECAG